MVKHTKDLKCLPLKYFKSIFNNFSMLRMKKHVIVLIVQALFSECFKYKILLKIHKVYNKMLSMESVFQ